MSLSIGETFLVPFLGNEMNKSPQLLSRGSTKKLVPKDHSLQDECKYQYHIMSGTILAIPDLCVINKWSRLKQLNNTNYHKTVPLGCVTYCSENRTLLQKYYHYHSANIQPYYT